MALKFFLHTTLSLEASCYEELLNWNKIDWMVSKHLSSYNLHQFKSIGKDHFWYLVVPTRQNTGAMAVKLFKTISVYQNSTVLKDFQIGIKR